MRLRARGCVWLALAGCSSASEVAPSPGPHDIVEVAVAPPASSAALTATSERVATSAGTTQPAAAPSHAPFDELRFSSGLGGASSAGVGGPTRSGSVLVTLLANAGGRVGNAGAVVAGMAAGFRRCYRRGLANAPTSAGRVHLVARIQPNGDVGSVAPNATGTLDGAVVSCLAARVSSAQFAPPEGMNSTLTISVTLSPS